MLLLLFIAMPLKYLMNYPAAVKVVGWIHGILFMVYVAVLLVLQLRERWPLRFFLFALVASLLPFGPFVLDKELRRKEEGTQV